MSDQSLNIFSLEIAINLLTGDPNVDSFKPAEVSFLSRAHNLFLSYYSKLHGNSDVPGVYEDFNYFVKNKDLNDLRAIAELLSHPEEGTEGEEKKPEKVREPEKEVSSVPAELETMVALYKEHQADLLDTDKPNSLSEKIKRAQKTWSEKRKFELIYENADKERQKEIDAQKEKADELYSQTVNPKLTRNQINQNTRDLASYALLTQTKNLNSSEYKEAVEKIVYLAETGGLDVTSIDSLFDITKTIVNEYTHEDKDLEELNNLALENQKARETELLDEINKNNKKIESLGEFVEDKLSNEREAYTKKFKEIDKELTKIDPDVLIGESSREIKNITEKLNSRFPNAKLQFQSPEISAQKIAELESLIRKVDSTALNANPSGLGARAAETVRVTGGNMGPVIDLYSKGLTKNKLEELSNKDTKEGRALKTFLNDDRSLRKRIERGLKVVQESPLGKELDGVYKKANYLIDPIGSGRTYINKQIGKYAGDQIKNQFGEAVGKKFEKYILGDGLKAGGKKFADEVAAKLITSAAKKLGLKTAEVAGASALAAASAALGISTAGLSLIIEAGIFIIGQGFKLIKKGVQEIKNSFGITEEDDKENKKALLIGLGALAATAFAVNRGAKMFGVATKAAVISAIGIIWLSLTTIAVFLTLTFLTAPILTTLVQFDSMEKVEYGPLVGEPSGSNDCKWPISGSYQVIEGPRGGTHSMSNLEAIDIWSPDINGKPIISVTDGKVVATGDYSNYGNTVQIQTTNSAGTFKVLYGHMSDISVSTGQQVKQGDKIGLVDSSAQFPSPHIHLEYQGIKYNDCPASGVKIRDGCVGYLECGSINTN